MSLGLSSDADRLFLWAPLSPEVVQISGVREDRGLLSVSPFHEVAAYHRDKTGD